MVVRSNARRAVIACAAILVASCGLHREEAPSPLPAAPFARAASHAVSALIVLHAFRGYTGGTSSGSPLLAVNGVLYGVANGGRGPCQCGIVYRLERDGSRNKFAPIYEFKGQFYRKYPDGAYPTGNLVAGAHGELYGVTSSGGSAGSGTVIKLTPSSRGYLESILYSFLGGADASQPDAMILFRGNLFGVGEVGGSASKGAVFELALSSSAYTESVLYSFKGGNDGAYPSKVLVDSKGNLYGITAEGGGGGVGYCSQGCGSVFEVSPASQGYRERVLHAFQGYSDGGFPNALTIGASGALYGTTSDGKGTVFELLPVGSTYSDSVIYQIPRRIGRLGSDEPNGPFKR